MTKSTTIDKLMRKIVKIQQLQNATDWWRHPICRVCVCVLRITLFTQLSVIFVGLLFIVGLYRVM